MLKELKQQITDARKARDGDRLRTLQVVVGEIETAESRTGKPLEDSQIHKIIRKIIAGNDETIEHRPDESLVAENVMLNAFLPQMWSQQQIVDALAEDHQAIQEARSDGQAMGIAMKTIKKLNAPAEADVVKSVVAQIRL